MPSPQAQGGDVVAEAQLAAALAGEAFAMASKAQQLLDGVARQGGSSMAGAAAPGSPAAGAYGSPTAFGTGLGGGGGSPSRMYPAPPPPPAVGVHEGGQVSSQQVFTGPCNVSFNHGRQH